LERYVERTREENKVKVIYSEDEYEYRGKRYFLDTVESEDANLDEFAKWVDDYTTYLILVEENGKKEFVKSFHYSNNSDFANFFGEKEELDEVVKKHISGLFGPIYADKKTISDWKKRNHISYNPKDINKYNKVLIHQVGKYSQVDINDMLDKMVSLEMFYVN